jgi:hypothetical protein
MLAVAELKTLSSVLGVLTSLIAPAVLISACGSLIQSTTARLLHNSERVRVLAAAMRRLEREGLVPDLERHQRLEKNLRWIYRRVRAEQKALVMFYSAAASFVGCSLALGLEALWRQLPNWLPVVLGLLGVLQLLVACGLLLVESHYLVLDMQGEREGLHLHDQD